MKAKLILCGLLMSSVVGCGDLFDKLTEEDKVPHFKTVDGKVAIEALGDTVGKVVGELNTILGQTGGGIAGPGTVTPPNELFEEEAASPAPGFLPASHEEGHLSAWKGPEVGPDGKEGWYYREATDSVWDYENSKTVIASWRYWMRFEPAYDIATNGVKGAKATHTNYAWSSETGPWVGWRYVIRFGVTGLTTGADGKVSPASVEGTWLWEIDSKAKFYRGSRSDGEYVYALGGAEHFLSNDDDEDDEAEEDPFLGLAVGGSHNVDFEGAGHWSYTGQHATSDNKIVGTWYGAGEYLSSGNAVVNRNGASTMDAKIEFTSESRGYWGQGAVPQEYDFTTPPAFAKDVTPAGDAWGIPQWISDNLKLTPRDGVLYWYDSSGAIIFDVAWDAVKAKAAADKIEAARLVEDDPDATEEARNKAREDLNKAYEEREAAYTKQDSQFRSKSKYLTWNGQEDEYEHVSCSSPELAADCPKDENGDQ